jgi:hypothetical protein
MSLLTSSNLETSWWYKVLGFDWPWSISLMLLAFLAVGVNNPITICKQINHVFGLRQIPIN